MYQWVRPQILVPVHGTLAHMREQAKLGKSCGIPQTIVPKNGTLIKLSKEGPALVETVKNGRLALDGSQVVPLFGPQMRDRARLMTSGILFVTIAFDKRGHLREEPQITQMGVFENQIESEMIENLQDSVTEAIANTPHEQWSDDSMMKEIVRVACRRCVNAERSKKPTTIVHITR